MGKRRSSHLAEDLDQEDAVSVARSLQEDFVSLIAIFDRQLANHSIADGDARSKISDAKLAAQRGLTVSQELSEFLRASR